ncbi:MAG: hypothetical protein J7L57_03935 [Deltaproteobacteria bacterium]|nr:hypothetical protein [Candidatus Tharpella sp.]
MAEKYGNEDLVVVFGLNQPFTLRIMARTFKEGDPSYAGPLAGVALGLKSYHLLELKDEIPEDLWDNEMGMAELELEDEVQAEIKEIMVEIRA